MAIARAAGAAAFIADSIDRLQEFPHSGRVLPEIGSLEYREIPYRSHRVIDKVQKSNVAILTIRHAKQRLDSAEVRTEE